MTTGQLIKVARKNAGMTQSELAQRLNIPFQSVSQWERDLRNPKYDTIKRIAAALGVEWTDLVPEGQQGQTVIEHFKSSLCALQTPVERINAAVQKMDKAGQTKVADYAEDILPRYRTETASQPAQEPQEGTDTTPPENAPEEPLEPSEEDNTNGN